MKRNTRWPPARFLNFVQRKSPSIPFIFIQQLFQWHWTSLLFVAFLNATRLWCQNICAQNGTELRTVQTFIPPISITNNHNDHLASCHWCIHLAHLWALILQTNILMTILEHWNVCILNDFNNNSSLKLFILFFIHFIVFNFLFLAIAMLPFKKNKKNTIRFKQWR